MNKCNHNWKEDELFKSGACVMLFGDIGDVNQETRVICKKCGCVDYIRKDAIQENNEGKHE